MQVNSVSFKGLWRGPQAERVIGKDNNCKNGTIYRQTYWYCPFKDESMEDILATANKMNKSIFALNDLRDDDPYGYEAYYSPDVKIGERLNVTAQEYENLMSLKPAIFEDTKDCKFDVLSNEQAGKLIQRNA